MKVRKKRKLTSLLFLLATLNLFVACGSSDDDDDDNSSPERQETRNQEDQGSYQVILTPLNTSVAGNTTGEVLIRIRGDEVEANADITGAPPSIIHPQNVHVGTSCPTAGSDQNTDGVIDNEEARIASGNILIPLDNSLDTQQVGTYPSADDEGAYTYDEDTSLTRMVADLKAEDTTPEDEFDKLAADENLNLAGRVVIIYGAGEDSNVPIACGTFVRVTENEEEPAPAPVPVPVPTPTPTPTEPCPPQADFNTRLTDELLISGSKCPVGETTTIEDDGEFREWSCRRNDWLVIVDTISSPTCTEDECTEADFLPVVVTLNRTGSSNPPDQCTYNFRPASSIPQEWRRVLNRHEVRFFDDQDPEVRRK